MKLRVKQHAVIQLAGRTFDGITAVKMLAQNEQIRFPMLIIHRLRVVG
jgi:hypothetical protein